VRQDAGKQPLLRAAGSLLFVTKQSGCIYSVFS